MLCKDRHGNVCIEENSQDNLMKGLYGTLFGRAFLRLITRPGLSKVIGKFLDSKYSVNLIEPFIKSNNIDMSDYIKRQYVSYNDFFTREIKPECRPVNYDSNVLISPADGRVSAYKIDENSVFKIKDSYYTVESILRSKKAAANYIDGYCVIVRLCVDNYHRYAYPDNGVLGSSKFINGVLHTVNPEALNHYDIYKENCRQCSVLHTQNFGKITFVEVGALMVGRIVNNHVAGHVFGRGQEKGKFEFGGSTVVMFIEKDKVVLDNDLLKNTNDGFETRIYLGEQIGVKDAE